MTTTARTPPTTRAAVLIGAPLALVGTYWDEAWHTDVGRDSFFAPPHLVLYAGSSPASG